MLSPIQSYQRERPLLMQQASPPHSIGISLLTASKPPPQAQTPSRVHSPHRRGAPCSRGPFVGSVPSRTDITSSGNRGGGRRWGNYVAGRGSQGPVALGSILSMLSLLTCSLARAVPEETHFAGRFPFMVKKSHITQYGRWRSVVAREKARQ